MNCTDFSTCAQKFYDSFQIQDLILPCSGLSSYIQKVSDVFSQKISSLLEVAVDSYRRDPTYSVILLSVYGLGAVLATTYVVRVRNGTLPPPWFVTKIRNYLYPPGFTQKRMDQLKLKEDGAPLKLKEDGAPFNETFALERTITNSELDEIPAELFPLIFSNLDAQSLLNCRLIHPRLCNLVNSNPKIVNEKCFPRLLKRGLDTMLSSALSAWTKYHPTLLLGPPPSRSRMEAVRQDLRSLAWFLRDIDPQLGKQFCKKDGLNPLGFIRNFENLNQILPPEFQDAKIEKQEDLFHYLHKLLASEEKGYLRRVVKFFRVMKLTQTDPTDEALKTATEDNWNNPYQEPKGYIDYFFGSLFHLLRVIHDKPSEHPSKDLTTMKFMVDLVNGDLFRSNPKRLLDSLDQCIKADKGALSTISDLNETINAYKPHLKAFLLLLTKHTNEALQILNKIPSEKMGILAPLLAIALGTLENDEEKADKLFKYIRKLPLDSRAFTFLSQKRLVSYFREKCLEKKISELDPDSRYHIQRIINRLRGHQILTETVNKWLEIENPDSDEKRTEIFKKHSSIICQLLFNLPNSFWRDIKKAKRIKKMAESVPNTPGIGYATVAAIRLRALWAISNQTEREELLADLRLQIEPIVFSPSIFRILFGQT